MPSVGPELPPHLAKRKRSIDEAEDPKSPPRKVLAAIAPIVGPTLPPSKNPDELDVGDSSDDDYGPSLGPSKPATKAVSPPTKRVLGPAPPPTTNPDELNVEDSSDDDYGPSAPASKPISAAPVPKRVLGPAPPPAPLSERPSQPANEDSSDDDDEDDDYGPSLPPPPGSAAETTYLQRQAEQQTLLTSTTEPTKPQRDDWMLVPPSDSDWSSRIDPTKLKNRKFASGKGAKAPPEKTGISAIWTETPLQKRQRLADEVLGRSDPSSSSTSTSTSKPTPLSKEEQATERRIREYNEKNRGRSLLEVRREAQERGRVEKEEEEDDPSKRGFDREKDMALGGRMGHVKKKEMLSRAADFGSRFQRGKFL
ncbi:hypothetical protein EG329_004771 [Mollisiaceae sp. DMI_Dod_QoI]|nr:hypothetical protein EG329_004771 [Helotiales sp. DMI_Dod_QoI]